MRAPRAAGTAAVLLCCLVSPMAPAAPAATPVPVPLRLDYALYSHGLHLMEIEVTLRLTPDGYAVAVHNRATGLLGMLTHTDVTSTASGRFDGIRAVPVSYASSGMSRGAQRTSRIAYPDGEPLLLELHPVDRDRDPIPAADARHGIDTLGALAGLLRTLDRTGRCDGQARIYDGLRLSAVSVRTVGPDPLPPVARSPFDGPALRCDFTSQQLGGFLHNADEAKARLPQHGSAWLATPAPAAMPLPVRVVFDNPRFGTATLYLTKILPAA